MAHRFRPSLLTMALAVVVGLFLAGSFLALRLWIHPQAPRVVRMLPRGETLAYLNLEPLREFGLLAPEAIAQGLSGLGASPAYADFVKSSGFDFERDLNTLACALDGSPLHPDQTTCIVEGEFSAAFVPYLSAHAFRAARTDGRTAYAFAGWARPQQTLWIVPLDRRHVLATNAPDRAAIVRQARRWWQPSPPLWRSPVVAPAPIGYLAIDALRLAAARQIDGATPPWQGARRLELRLTPGLRSGIRLQGQLDTLTEADAARTLAWAQDEVARLLPLLPRGRPGQLSVGDALRRANLHQHGNQVDFRLQLSTPANP